MDIYDVVMKGPPKWILRATFTLIVLTVGLQIGMYKERSTQTAEYIQGEFAKKNAETDKLKIAYNVVSFDLEVEKEKLSILLCESGIKHEGVWGDGGESYGIAQWQYATFKDLRELAGRPWLKWKNRDDQIWLLDWALRNGYGKYWTCYSKRKGGQRI